MLPDHITCCYLYPITKYGYPPPAEQTGVYLQEMHDLGFSSVELEGIHEPHLRMMYEGRFKTRETMERLGLSVPYFCIVLPELSSPDRATRDYNLKLFEKGCETAHVLGADGVLDNAPLPPYVFPEDVPVVRHYEEDVLMDASFPQEMEWSRYWTDLVETFRTACDIAAHYNLTYQMHPCMGVLCANTDGFINFYNAVQRDNLRFNLDTANQFVLKDNLALSLRRLVGKVDYIHLSDNRGHHVEHLEPGKGAINWDVFFNELTRIGYKGRFGLDIGGSESDIEDLDAAYTSAARWLLKRWPSTG
ncbi:MAG: sugar phosphate isomerase/epimerase [Rhodothermaceae bacterium]|nr:sugar phosphate isomerase/epimerase [Rhodothermaceae bacterium]